MAKIFFAIYDDSTRKVPHRTFQKIPYVIYRTTNMGFVEELSGLGFEPTAVLLEEDIAALKDGQHSDDSMTEEDIKFLNDHLEHWEWTD